MDFQKSEIWLFSCLDAINIGLWHIGVIQPVIQTLYCLRSNACRRYPLRAQALAPILNHVKLTKDKDYQATTTIW